ncbi:ABC transporter permease [Allostreptomyces psammosilenae]|uniref:ABC transporter permease n=1 Tax=Allostreptomyces psammosilenae TaxID=1892865 RepID=UPI0015CBA7B4
MSTQTNAVETAEQSGAHGSGAGRPAAGGGRSDDSGRIGLRGNVRHTLALARRNVLLIRADPEQLFDAVAMPIIFTAMFVYVFGGAIAGDREDYLQYLVPGLMAQTGIMVSMSVGSAINADIKLGVMDRFRSMPIARSSVLVARVFTDLGRMLVSQLILIGFAMVLGLRIQTSPLDLLVALALICLFGTALSWIFLLMGLTLNSPQAVQGIGMLVLMPLQFGSSIFAPVETMPGWLQAFADVNPMSLVADACRVLVNGGEVAGPLTWSLVWIVGITVVAAPLAVRRFQRAV